MTNLTAQSSIYGKFLFMLSSEINLDDLDKDTVMETVNIILRIFPELHNSASLFSDHKSLAFEKVFKFT